MEQPPVVMQEHKTRFHAKFAIGTLQFILSLSLPHIQIVNCLFAFDLLIQN
jgi:hypothetical protein